MPFSDFTEARFGDLLSEPLRNGVYKSKEHHGRGVKVVNMGELFGHSRLRDVPMKRLALTEPELRKSTLRPGDLLFARRSLVAEGAGKCSVVKQVNEPTTFESSIIRARPDPRLVDSDYLYYYFGSPQGRELMRTILRQVAVSGIASSDLAELRVPVPSIEVQRKCARILELMDDRIDLLRETNTTLESIAQALFKSWFIDFDPVRAKAEGREPEGMNATTAALLPAEFEESALGLIPKGWTVTPFSETVNVLGGGTPKTTIAEYWNGDIPWFSVVDAPAEGQVFTLFTEKSVTLAGVENSSTRVLPAWTTIISARGTVGKLAMVARPMAMNQSCYGLATRQTGAEAVVYLSAQRLVHDLKRLAHGGVFDTITRDTLASVHVVRASPEVTAAFGSLVRPIFEQIQAGVSKMATLVEIRDALLPRLISGKLRLHEAHPQLEEAFA